MQIKAIMKNVTMTRALQAGALAGAALLCAVVVRKVAGEGSVGRIQTNDVDNLLRHCETALSALDSRLGLSQPLDR